MNIRKATMQDMPELLRIYETARQFMRANGNPLQWDGGYPQEDILVEDIAREELYVFEHPETSEPCGVFWLEPGIDPTYGYIEDGAWIDDSPYVTIHRIASDGRERGILASAVQFAYEQCPHVRIDTHEKNIPMQNGLAKLGFKRCGIIFLENGDPRTAFELSEKVKAL